MPSYFPIVQWFFPYLNSDGMREVHCMPRPQTWEDWSHIQASESFAMVGAIENLLYDRYAYGPHCRCALLRVHLVLSNPKMKPVCITHFL
ncbi:hypothetical protein MKX01_033882 [Papaver californicum]|nr:hypothetical protein MKX01_033882 [Papaver californicum]